MSMDEQLVLPETSDKYVGAEISVSAFCFGYW